MSAGRPDSAVSGEEAAQLQQQEDHMQDSTAEAVLHMERGLLNRGTRAAARQAALFQDRHSAGDTSFVHACLT